ncbi:helicase-related protein [Shewanella sp. UCD-KL12]|uniref:helicase-related protein n=1 Tax=Shewanella sp. UCD-KL12 TaxID=1917163 RepID=UPI002115F93B|nr:helicase-related protein [Shewanella sp. UCD-KL12]
MSKMSAKSITLPIDKLYDEFRSAIKDNHLVVESDTGSGKSTRLPLWCAKAGCAEAVEGGRGKRVLVVEPRRVACLALCSFVSSLFKDAEGSAQSANKVGYAIRFDSTVTDTTQIAFVTPGIALRWLQQDGLASFDTVIIDEFHERRWDTDLLLAILKLKAQESAELRLVLTSATIDGERLTDYLGTSLSSNTASDSLSNTRQVPEPKSQRLVAEGKRFHVELKFQARESHHLPDIRGVEQAVKTAVSGLLNDTQGDILVFLPGKREIQSCLQACGSLFREAEGSLLREAEGSLFQTAEGSIELLALHGGITPQEQEKVLQPANHQRVIFSTNVAETSLTIPGVTAVVDSGLERRTHQRNGRTVLSLARISKASAAQRMGRAGRTQDGICIRLWGKSAPMEAMTPPELQREELVEPLLTAACCGYRLSELSFVDQLPEKSLMIATNKLVAMGAVNSDGIVTAHGRKISPLPIDTLFAHLISAMPDDTCRGLMIDLAAALSVPQRLFQLPSDEFDLKELNEWEPLSCDAFTLIKILREPVTSLLKSSSTHRSYIDTSARKEARLLAEQIRTALGLESINKANTLNIRDDELRRSWLLAVIKASPELAFVRREKRFSALGNGFSEVQIGRDSRFSSELKMSDGKESALAAVVFDQHSIAGKGSKQTLNLASCMAPISFKLLSQAALGEERLAENREQGNKHKVLVETVYAGRVIASHLKEVEGAQAIEAIVRSIKLGRQFKGVASQLERDIAAWNIWLAVGKADKAALSMDLDQYLADKLIELGVECFDDLQMIEASDLLFEGVPEWEREEFDRLYPTKLLLAELKLTVEYQAKRKLVTVIYASGMRKTGPKRWELPRWQGWKIQYRKASRVVDVK